MVFEHIEKLKQEYTDKYVAIANMVPELKRFEGRTGIVRTVNMSGRALVEFLGSNDISWYDIDVDFLKIVPAPEPTEAKKTDVKGPADKSSTSEVAPKKKSSANTADILAMARGKSNAKPAGDKPESKKPSTADILAAARGKASKPKSESTELAKDTKSLSTAEKLALLRGEGNKSPEAPQKKDDSPQKPSTADILAMARGKKPAALDASEEASPPKDPNPPKPSTADILAMARGQKKKKEDDSSDSEKPSSE